MARRPRPPRLGARSPKGVDGTKQSFKPRAGAAYRVVVVLGWKGISV